MTEEKKNQKEKNPIAEALNWEQSKSNFLELTFRKSLNSHFRGEIRDGESTQVERVVG